MKIVHTSIFRKDSDLELVQRHMEDIAKTDLGKRVAKILCAPMPIARVQSLNSHLAKTGFIYKVRGLWEGNLSPENEQYLKDFVARFGHTAHATESTECEATLSG